METDKRTVYVVAAVTVVVALLSSCLIGTLAGGAAGFFVARRQADAAIQQRLEREQEGLREVPLPGLEELPLPSPGTEGEQLVPPLGGFPSDLEGAVVVRVVPGAPADEAGIKAGDVIVAVDRVPVDANHPLPKVVAQYRPGDRLTVHFWRGGQEDSVVVKLGENPDAPEQAYLGVFFEMVTRPE